jgi:holo-[acyl-carrier protein] synthase
MILGLGIDIIEVERIKQKIKNKNFLSKVFTKKEIELCEKSRNKNEKYAVRFAAKEAFMKAIGTGWAKGIKFNEIEILNEESGKPFVLLYGKTKEISDKIGVKKILVSLSHTKNYANSVVILE